MSESESLGSFLKENKKLATEYVDTKLDIYKLRLIRIFSKSAGYFAWIVISFFLLWLFIIFLGLVTGFWLSSITGNYTIGFAITTIAILVLLLILALLRKKIFVNPIIRAIIKNVTDEKETEE